MGSKENLQSAGPPPTSLAPEPRLPFGSPPPVPRKRATDIEARLLLRSKAGPKAGSKAAPKAAKATAGRLLLHSKAPPPPVPKKRANTIEATLLLRPKAAPKATAPRLLVSWSAIGSLLEQGSLPGASSSVPVGHSNDPSSSPRPPPRGTVGIENAETRALRSEMSSADRADHTVAMDMAEIHALRSEMSSAEHTNMMLMRLFLPLQ